MQILNNQRATRQWKGGLAIWLHCTAVALAAGNANICRAGRQVEDDGLPVILWTSAWMRKLSNRLEQKRGDDVGAFESFSEYEREALERMTYDENPRDHLR